MYVKGTARDVLMRIRTMEVVGVHVWTTQCAHIYNVGSVPSVNHNLINLVAGSSRQPSGFVDVEMLIPGATD